MSKNLYMVFLHYKMIFRKTISCNGIERHLFYILTCLVSSPSRRRYFDCFQLHVKSVIHSSGDESKTTEYDTRTWMENAKATKFFQWLYIQFSGRLMFLSITETIKRIFFRGRKKEKKNFHVNTFDVKFYLLGFVGVFVWNIFIIWLIVSVWSMRWNVSGFAFLYENALKISWETDDGKRTENENHFRSVKLIFLGQVFWGNLNKFILVPCFV